MEQLISVFAIILGIVIGIWLQFYIIKTILSAFVPPPPNAPRRQPARVQDAFTLRYSLYKELHMRFNNRRVAVSDSSIRLYTREAYDVVQAKVDAIKQLIKRDVSISWDQNHRAILDIR